MSPNLPLETSPVSEAFSCTRDVTTFMQSTTSRNSSVLCLPPTKIHILELSVFHLPPSSHPSFIFYRAKAIPFGDSASGDYATCAKAATTLAYIQDSPVSLQPAILQAILEDTYIDDGGVGASSDSEIKGKLKRFSARVVSP